MDNTTKPAPKSQDTYKALSLPELMDGPTTIDWRVKDLIPPKSTGLLAGDSGVGKTWLTLRLALDVALGVPWLGQFPTRQGPVLIVDEENADLLLRVRLDKMLKARNLNPAKIPVSFLVGIGVNLSPVKDRAGILTPTNGFLKLRDTLKALQPSLVIFDSLTRCHTSNENASNEMASVFANVRELVDVTGASLLFTHHIRKGNASGNGDSGQRIRGSSDIRAFADFTLLVDKTDTGVTVIHDKSRWAERVDPFGVKFAYTDNTFDLTFDGEKPIVTLRSLWEWLRDQLELEPLTRAQLIDRAKVANLCKERKLDDTLKWRVEHGYLSKIKIGHAVGFGLADKGENELAEAAMMDLAIEEAVLPARCHYDQD